MNAIAPKGRDAGPGISPGELVAYVLGAELREAVAALFPEALVHEGGMAAAASAPPGDAGIVLAELAPDADQAAEIRALRDACRPSSRIIAAGPVNDVLLYHRIVEAGADDYIVTPAAPDLLAAAVRRAARRAPEGADDSRPMRTIMVTGARGGAGATTFATGAAWHISSTLGRKVALVDLDLHFGTVSLGLDLEPSHGLREILENPDRVDALFVNSAMARLNENLAVLAAEEGLDSPTMIRGAAFERLAAALAEHAEFLLVDAPAAVLMNEPELVGQADELVVVSEMNLAAIRDTLRLAAFARDAGFSRAPVIVGNKAAGKGPAEVDHKEFARGVGQPVDFVLPLDVKAVCEAAKAGRPVADVAPKSPLAATIGAVACKLAALEPESGRRGLLGLIKRRG